MKTRGIKNMFTLILLVVTSNGFPLPESLPESKGLRQEKVLPNGTVVGQYEYLDRDGNPVHVKYYADESNYGVELNSVKIISKNVPEVQPKTEYPFSTFTTTPTTPFKETLSEKTTFLDMKLSPSIKKYKSHDPLDVLTKETTRTSSHRTQKLRPDYETYTVKSFGDPQRCNNKVRVYNVEPENRKARKTFDDKFLYTNQICDDKLM